MSFLRPLSQCLHQSMMFFQSSFPRHTWRYNAQALDLFTPIVSPTDEQSSIRAQNPQYALDVIRLK